jgi:hypothetical protein
LGSEPAEEYRRLRGRVDVDSVPGEGRTFRIVFPGVPARSAKPGTTTRKGLKVHAEIDDGSYPAGIKVPDEVMDLINFRG